VAVVKGEIEFVGQIFRHSGIESIQAPRVFRLSDPRPAGRPWTREEEDQLRSMLDADAKAGLVAN
jgi:hypothetical protein